MAKLTNQEVFDKVYLGLASQGFRRSLSEEGGCAYRGQHGRKCAAGWIIPDDLYQQRLETLTVTSFSVFGIVNPIVEDVEFLSFLQRIHDTSQNPDWMKYKLDVFARHHNLTVPEIPSDV